MADEHYKVRKTKGQKEWKVIDRKTGEVKGVSTKSKWHARVAAHIRGNNSKKYQGPVFLRKQKKAAIEAQQGPKAAKHSERKEIRRP